MQEEWVCVNCGISIRWQPTIVDGKTYCCPGCAQGGPCNCDYDNLPQSDRAGAVVLCREHNARAPHGRTV